MPVLIMASINVMITQPTRNCHADINGTVLAARNNMAKSPVIITVEEKNSHSNAS